MRIVADTSTLVSGFGWGGPPGQVVDTVLSGQVTLVISPALPGELARVLAYPELAVVFDDPAVLVAAVAEAADTADPAEHVTVLAGEPDNRVLEAAAAGRADLIVTGDKAMQELGSFREIPIVSAAQFVTRLQQQDLTGPPGPNEQTPRAGNHRRRSGCGAADRAGAVAVLADLMCMIARRRRVISDSRVMPGQRYLAGLAASAPPARRTLKQIAGAGARADRQRFTG